MAIAQTPRHQPLMHHLLHCIDQVFQDEHSSPRRQIVSTSKLAKGDATWAMQKRILGWDVDTVMMTLQLPSHRLARLQEAIRHFMPLRRTSRHKWHQFLGELCSMAMAFWGAKYLFSILQHDLVDQHGPRIKLTPLVKQALQDWAALATQLHAYPVPIHTLVPAPPHYLTADDASKIGMGGSGSPPPSRQMPSLVFGVPASQLILSISSSPPPTHGVPSPTATSNWPLLSWAHPLWPPPFRPIDIFASPSLPTTLPH
jgi:hypothetical protein